MRTDGIDGVAQIIRGVHEMLSDIKLTVTEQRVDGGIVRIAGILDAMSRKTITGGFQHGQHVHLPIRLAFKVEEGRIVKLFEQLAVPEVDQRGSEKKRAVRRGGAPLLVCAGRTREGPPAGGRTGGRSVLGCLKNATTARHPLRQVASPRDESLFQCNRESAQIRVRQQSHLSAAQFQHCALLVGQHDGASTTADRKPRPRSGVDACDIRRALDVAHRSVQHGLRAAEDEAVVQSAGRQPLGPSPEVEGAAATGTADDPSSLVDREPYGPAVGIAGGGQADEGKECNQRRASGG
jgi:hypothetical protein